MELKVWVEGIQRIVCGVTEKTTCQDVVYALAHATGKTGRFTLIERWRNNERLLAPQENPLKVLQKWGEYASDVQFILQRSALDSSSSLGSKSALPASSFSPTSNRKSVTKDQSQQPAAVWKPPPQSNARLSPDSGRGSDRTVGSDTSYSDKEQQSRGGRVSSQGHPYPGYNPMAPTNGHMGGYRYPSTTPVPTSGYPPAYRPPPQPVVARNSSPAASSSAAEYPPPYRNPPPPPRYRNATTNYPVAAGGGGVVRPPHYSPPPTHRNALSRHPSRSSLIGSNSTRSMNQHGLPPPPNGSRPMSSRSGARQPQNQYNKGMPSPDIHELMNLVSAQQSTLYSQQAEIKQCDAETTYLENYYQQQHMPPHSSASSSSSLRIPLSLQNGSSHPNSITPSGSLYQQSEGQIDLVLSEVRRLEEVAQRNDEELHVLSVDGSHQLMGSGVVSQKASKDEDLIKSELSHLKHRLAGTDQELQKTNYTLRRLGEEMRSMSMEKSRQREQELSQEIERLQNEIKLLQKSSEEGATISQKLSQEVKDVEDQISQRKAEVEKLIKEMREANMESLAISPPEESKQFPEGPMKPGAPRKMLSSPRALESAVPTAKNPHGVWV